MSISTKVDLSDDGILWLINTTIFHPRGLALSRRPDGHLYLVGDGEEVWIFDEDTAQQKKDAFEATLKFHLSKVQNRDEPQPPAPHSKTKSQKED